MLLLENCSLKHKHTFHLDLKTRYWADFESVEELHNILTDRTFQQLPVLPVGGGSNLLFTADFPGLLVHSAIKTMELIEESSDYVLIRVGSGVVWDDFVAHAVRQGWSGAENLSGIPGEVGASPVQNIGAYGAEAKDLVVSVEALNRKRCIMETFSHEACEFGYRESIFKKALKDQYVVCYVTFRLSTIFFPNMAYGDVATRVRMKGEPTPDILRQTILEIRGEKLPDPNITGNAGSFFMNPVITTNQYQALKQTYPDIPGWVLDEGRVKVSAAWCIEKTGWKGRQLGHVGVHPRQPLVLINLGEASAAEVIALSDKIRADVETLFGLSLKPEVLFI